MANVSGHEHDRRLTALFWELNHVHFGGILTPIDLRFSGRLKTTGGQYFRSRAARARARGSTRIFG
ncbi:MAG: hypothetical protein HY075_11280 [Deltaproteobacteria bacterium]|nr:hypothetical protein [Deltaproteobacteria bacterium]